MQATVPQEIAFAVQLCVVVEKFVMATSFIHFSIELIIDEVIVR